MSNQEKKYYVDESYYGGGCYISADLVEVTDYRAGTDADAYLAEYASTYLAAEGDLDMRFVLIDDDEEELGTYLLERNENEDLQEETEEIATEIGEFSTTHIGHDSNTIYTWETNGGERGAHDRQDGLGRWVERYNKPEEISPAAAKKMLVERFGFSWRKSALAISSIPQSPARGTKENKMSVTKKKYEIKDNHGDEMSQELKPRGQYEIRSKEGWYARESERSHGYTDWRYMAALYAGLQIHVPSDGNRLDCEAVDTWTGKLVEPEPAERCKECEKIVPAGAKCCGYQTDFRKEA